MGIREGFSEEVAEELSLEDEDAARWKAGKVLQVVGMAGGNVGRKESSKRVWDRVEDPGKWRWKLWERDKGQISQG